VSPDAMWAFPKRKPQWFARSPYALAMATLSYPLVRSVPRSVRLAAVGPLSLPVGRRLWAERAAFAPPPGEPVWLAIRDELVPQRAERLAWVFFQSQWRVSRFAAMGLDRIGTPRAFVTVDPAGAPRFHPSFVSTEVRIPAGIGEVEVDGWTGRRFEVVPRLTTTPTCSWERIVTVAADVSDHLARVLPRPSDTPAHWRPMHGDFTPWNLRQDRRGRLWLLDWEEAEWAPRVADVLRYAAAVRSMEHDDVAALVAAVAADVPATEAELAEAGEFWIRHHNFALDHGEGDALTDGKADDLARGHRELDAFRALAGVAG